jgi:glutamate/aspartate transport system substrate-binding protein
MKRILLLALCLFAASAAQAQTLERIRSTGTVSIAYRTDSFPFAFDDPATRQPSGYTIDICKRVVASLQRQLNLPSLAIKWVPANAQNRMEMVAKGQADMECGATTATFGRMAQVDFSNLVFVDGGGLLVRVESNIKTLGDLAGKKIAIIGGTTTQAALSAALKKRLVDAQLVPVKTREEGLAQLEGGKVDAFASDRVLLVGLGDKALDPKKLAMVGEDFSFEPYAIVLPRGDAAFRVAVNRGLAQLYGSGDIGEIFNRYFGSFGQPSVLLAAMYYLNALPE